MLLKKHVDFNLEVHHHSKKIVVDKSTYEKCWFDFQGFRVQFFPAFLLKKRTKGPHLEVASPPTFLGSKFPRVVRFYTNPCARQKNYRGPGVVLAVSVLMLGLFCVGLALLLFVHFEVMFRWKRMEYVVTKTFFCFTTEAERIWNDMMGPMRRDTCIIVVDE